MKRYYYITPQDYETAKQNGISYNVLYCRVHKYGWDIDRAITEPVKTSIAQWDKWGPIAESNGVHRKKFVERLNKGMSHEMAATTPLGERTKRKIPKSYVEKAIGNGINKNAFYARISRGWGCEMAATIPLNKPKNTHTRRQPSESALKNF